MLSTDIFQAFRFLEEIKWIGTMVEAIHHVFTRLIGGGRVVEKDPAFQRLFEATQQTPSLVSEASGVYDTYVNNLQIRFTPIQKVRVQAYT